jgi:hypothetical protein
MTLAAVKTNSSKSKGELLLEYILLGLCLCVIALRTTFTEGPGALSATMPINVSDVLYSLSISAVLAFPCIFWLLWTFCRKNISYRVTGLELGIFLFCISSIVSGFSSR